MTREEKERLIKKDIVSIENRVRHAFNQGYEIGLKDRKNTCEDTISRADARHLIAETNRNALGYTSTKVFKKLYDGIDKLPSVTPQEPIREFTEEEVKAYSKTLDKMYKPPGFNVFNEPYKDAISRQAVLDIDFHRIMHTTAKPSEMIKQKVKALASVMLQPKTGHWIKYGVPRCGEQHYKCTSCGYYINFGQWGELYTKEFKYCPNCGAKMVESQESEE